MRCVIRSLTQIGTVSEYRDDTVEAEAINIGRSLDQNIVLPGNELGLRHARVAFRGGKVEISAIANNEITLNGQVVERQPLQIGDVIRLGHHTLKVITPPSGFDVAFELKSDRVTEEQTDYESQFKTSLAQTGLNKRRLSWLLGLVFLFSGLIIPFFTSHTKSDNASLSQWLVSDAFWISGPLVSAHQAELDHKCTTCHETPFIMVRNTACKDCHKTVARHTGIDQPLADELSQRRCATCHKEHNEPGTIIDNEQSDCSKCHATLDQTLTGRKTLKNVQDFDQSHPDFTLTLLVENPDKNDKEGKAWVQQRQYQSKQQRVKQVEQSNLKFNHKLHMDRKGVETPSGNRRRMVCEDCHQLDAAGMHNKPVNMKDHCEECHKLTFDPRAGDFTLPHGSVRQVVYVMEGFYQGSQLIKPAGRADLASVKGRVARRPRQRLNMLTDIASDNPKQRMENALSEVFERTTCVICHVVSKDKTANPPWTIKPVKLNKDWMPKAYFNHKSHSFKQCVDCHDSETSERSQDILMPGIKTCRECHSDSSSDGKLASPCIACHRFHIPGNKRIYRNTANIANEMQ